MRNVARLELILALMTLDLREQADERLFTRILRRLLEQNASTLVLPRRSLDDKGGSSLFAAIFEVERRLEQKRERNRRYSRAARSRNMTTGGKMLAELAENTAAAGFREPEESIVVAPASLVILRDPLDAPMLDP